MLCCASRSESEAGWHSSAHLDDSVPNPQYLRGVCSRGHSDLAFALLWRVEQRLQAGVQALHARWPLPHGCQHLHAHGACQQHASHRKLDRIFQPDLILVPARVKPYLRWQPIPGVAEHTGYPVRLWHSYARTL